MNSRRELPADALPAGPCPTQTRLPSGWVVRLDRHVRRLDGGAALLGGSPTRLLRLRPVARRLLADGDLRVDGPPSSALARLLLDRGMAHPVPGGMAEDRALTVVVPVRDRLLPLARLLDGLDPQLPVIVVDDGSQDPTALARLVGREQRAGRDVRLIRHDTPRGPAAARNTGLRHIGTPLAALLDSDVLPVPGWLATLLPHFDDPAVGLVAPRIVALPPSESRLGWLSGYEAARSSLDLGAEPALVAPRGRVSYVPTAALLLRTAAVGAGFDERLQVAEDVDLVWRLVRSGWRCRYEPGAQVAHDHRTRLRAWLARKAYYGTGAAPLSERHGDAVAPMVLPAWAAASWLALLAQRRWSLPAVAGLSLLASVRLRRDLAGWDQPSRTAAALATRTLAAGAGQTAGALTRHWWPLAAAVCLRSRRLRRAVLVAAVVEGLIDWRRTAPGLDPVRYLVARRLDDLAYGTGLWVGAWRDRTVRPLLPAISVGRPAAARVTTTTRGISRLLDFERRRVTAATWDNEGRFAPQPARLPS